jgi:tetratricopeptide (TPR) repeat protein
MKAPLFDDILRISQAIADASASENEAARDTSYQELIKLCANNDNSPRNHPLQWEALGDFTLDSEQAIDIYQKGLDIADKLSLTDFSASIHLSMGQRFQEMEELDKAKVSAEHANSLSNKVVNDELKTEIETFVKAVS